MTNLLNAMSGTNYIHHAAGLLESTLTAAFEQYVMDDEIIGMTCRVLKGLEVDDEHLALDTIDEVGPGGNFIVTEHTLRHMRTEYFLGNGVTQRESREKCQKNGSPDARERARKIARKLLNESKTDYISKDVNQKIRETYNIFLPAD